MCKERGNGSGGSCGGARAREERSTASPARLGEPADPAGSRARAGRSPGRSRDRARARPGLPSAASAPSPPPLARWGGARAQRLQLPSGRGPTPPTPGPGPARGEESAKERQVAGGQARMGRASDPGRRARGWRGGAGGGGRELLPLPGRPEWPKKEFLKIGRNSSEEVGSRKGTRNTPPHL